jgi:hypothetical protein
VTGEQAAAAEDRLDFTAFPVAEANELLLHAGFLHVLVAGLVDNAFFADGFAMADLANFFFPDRHALDAGDGAFFAHRDAFAAEGVVRFGTALDAIRGPLHLVGFTNPLIATGGTKHGAGRHRRRATRVTTARRPETMRPYGRNRHGGNGANQESQT